MPAATQNQWSNWWPLLLLIALRCAQANLTDDHPLWNPSIPAQCLGLLLAAFAMMLTSCAPATRAVSVPRVIAGTSILLAAQTPFLLGVPSPDAGATLLALTLVPGVIAVADASLITDDERSLGERLWPSLAAAAGVLSLVVQPSLSDWRQDLALALMPSMAGIGAAFFAARQTPGDSPGRDLGLPMALIVAAAVLGCTWLLFARNTVNSEPNVLELLGSSALAGLLAWLSLHALSAAGAERWSAQFVALPLVLLLEGPVLLGVHTGLREWVGFALILAAAARLLMARRTVH